MDEELRKSERTGKVLLGSNETLEATKNEEAKLATLSTTCPRDVEEKILNYAKENKIPLYYYSGGSKDLGLAIGKPFSVSVLTIIEPGDSNILDLGEIPNED